MTPGSFRIKSCMPQKQPPASTARSVFIAFLHLVRVPSRIQLVIGTSPIDGGSLLIAQIEHESDTVIPTWLEECAAEKYRHSAAVFPEVLLLVGLKDAVRFQIGHCLFVMTPPFGWR